jgi:alcohol dehydrogenase (cytochrome c)
LKTSPRVALCACASLTAAIVVAADNSQSTTAEKVLRPKPAALVPTVPVTAAIIERGARLYRENCAVCHGDDGRGDTPASRALPSRPSDQSNPQHMEAFEDQDIASRVQHGGFQMPAFPQIRGDDLIAVVAYVRSLSRESVRSLEIQSIAQGQVQSFAPVTDQMLEQPPDGDWLMYRRTYDSWGFSPLDEITRANVGNLELAWARVMTPGRQYITPLAHDGVLYLETPRDIIQALDARTGDLIWEYRYETAATRAEKPIAVTEVRGTRNIAIYGDKIFHLTRDAHVIALDARTGALVWDTPETGAERGITHSAGPIVVEGKVISGRAAAAGGGPEVAYIAAHDAQTGRELWRFHTIPRPGEPGDETWRGVAYEDRAHVGSWSVGSYDPELKLLFWGTSVPAPSLEVVRGTPRADALYSNSTVALDPQTGKLVWYYQHLPRDNWDLDHVFERYLIDVDVAPDAAEVRWINPALKKAAAGKRRVVSGIPGKTGIVFTLDAKTGEFLWARETIHQNVIRDINVRNGRVSIDEAMVPKPFQELRVCPSNAGGKNWMAGTYSPRTRLMYQPMLNMCMLQTGNADTFTRGMGYAVNWIVIEDPTVTGRAQYPVGRVDAVSLDTGKLAWHYEQRAGLVSGLVSTAGGLVFGGDANRRFKALDDETGRVLWETILAAPVSGHPISFAVDGHQYIAVSTGGNTHPEKTALSLHPEVKVTEGYNSLFVFRLRADTH